MLGINKSVIKLNSTNGENKLVGYIYKSESEAPKAIFMICHGMCEYIERYEDFANFMAQNGFVVCGYDHLGHGQTSDEQGGIDGYFGKKDGIITTIDDMKMFCDYIKAQFENLPLILMGHSMGSFFSRVFVIKHKDDVDAFIISGTAGPNPIGGLGIMAAKAIKAAKGELHRSQFLHDLAFKPYTKNIENPKTQYDWLTRDEQIVQKYANDKKCTYVFTVNGFLTLLNILQIANSNNVLSATNKNMPVLVMSGEMDAVGNYSKGPQYVFEQMKNAGVKNIQLKLYEGARHEMLNETNKQDAYNDVLTWCNANAQKKEDN